MDFLFHALSPFRLLVTLVAHVWRGFPSKGTSAATQRYPLRRVSEGKPAPVRHHDPAHPLNLPRIETKTAKPNFSIPDFQEEESIDSKMNAGQPSLSEYRYSGSRFTAKSQKNLMKSIPHEDSGKYWEAQNSGQSSERFAVCRGNHGCVVARCDRPASGEIKG